MAPVAKRKKELTVEVTDETDTATVPAGSKKRKHDLSWLIDGLAAADPFPVLKEFIDAADQYVQRGKKAELGDVVKDFLENGGTGKEVLSLLDSETKRKASETSLVFTTLEKIFTRCSQDLSEYRDVVMKTASAIVQSYMVKIYMTMAPSSNANQIKSALRLLISMVALSHVTAREVVARFDFSHACVEYMLKRRSLVDLPDVRTTYVMFIISLLMEEDNMVLRTLGENLAILRPVFAGLIFDNVGLVQLFITALRDKVVMSNELSKTLKMRIFNTNTLQTLSRLFFWLGPTKAPKKHMKQDEETLENDQPIDETTEDDLIAVSEVTQSLFVALTSSHKYGIAFADHDLGLSGQNRNSMVFSLLETLGDFYERSCSRLVELQKELVVKSLIGCPDLVRPYTSEIAKDLSHPRMSRAYLDLCSMAEEIVASQNVTIVFNPKEKYTVKQQAKRAAALIAPYALGQEIFVAALSDENAGVKVAVGEILLTILDKAIEFQDILSHHQKAKMYNDQERKAIFSNFKELLRLVVPGSSVITESCSQLSALKDRPESINYWAVLLKLLARYSSLGLVKEDAPIPASLIVNDIVECAEESHLDERVLENLIRSLFDYVNSLADLSRIAGAQQRALIGQIVKRLAATESDALRKTANALLFKIMSAIIESSPVELNAWTTCLSRYPESGPFLAAVLRQLHMSDSIENRRFELLTSAWKSASGDERSTAYVTAATCELLLVQDEAGIKPFVECSLKIASPTLGALLKAFSKPKTKFPKEIASLGAGPVASELYRAALSDAESLDECKKILPEAGRRLDVLGLALHQSMTCIAMARAKNVDPIRLVDVLRLVQDSDADPGRAVSRLFLTHASTRAWFDPTKSDDAFFGAFNAVVRDALTRVADQELDRSYQLKFVECIERLVKADGTFALEDTRDVVLSISQLNIQDVEPLVTLFVDSNEPGKDWQLKYLDMFLQRVARLRLEGPSQRISWSVFQRVLKIFVQLGSPSTLLKGIHDVISVCPEFLDSVDDFSSVLKACLGCEDERSNILRLLIANSNQLRASFGAWCLEHEEHFENINWRIQLLPAYFESDYDENVLKMLHKKLSPKFKEILITGNEYRSVIGQSEGVEEFMRFLIAKCWTNEDCSEVTEKLLHQSKGEVLVVQFSEAGRHGNRQDIHLKLCVRSVIRQFKSEESADCGESRRVADELDWLAKQSKYDGAELGRLVLRDPNWAKFLKYTLRIGLRAMTSSESPLPPIALRIMANVWRLFLASKSEETEAVSKQIFDMITSHSDFMTVIMDEEDAYPEQKRLLLQLLTVLIEVNPKLCQGSQVPLLLASYRAKRSVADQLILGLLRSYEKNDVKLSPYKPYLWGSAAAVHYSIQRSGTASKLSQQPAAGEVVALLDPENLLKTAYNYPGELRLNSSEQVAGSDQYDPRFLLPVLAHILSTIYSVQCVKFTQTGAISLLFASLSSSCGEMRALGWLALSRLSEQIQNAVAWPERCLWLHLIECVRLGAAEYFRDLPPAVSRQHPPRLSSIVTLFLAKAAAIIRDPLHPMYRTVNNFLVVKPVMDVTQVPEFFVMMHSTELAEQKALYRSFLLGLLKDGMKSRQDYLVCARRRVFRILLSFQPSELLADKTTKSMILEVVQSALRNPIIAYDLIRNRGLIMWLDGLLLGQNRNNVDASRLLNVVETLWNTLYGHLQEKRSSCGTNEEDAVAELEREVEAVEAEEADAKQTKKTGNVKEEKNNKSSNPYSRKPIWHMLPAQNQVIAPWLLYELVQVMVNLWSALSEAEVNSENFEAYTRVLRSATTHLHEAKRLMRELQEKDPKNVRFVGPSKTLSLRLMRELVAASARFVTDLPDLKDHLNILEMTKVRDQADPSLSVTQWQRRYESMRKLLGEEDHNLPIRQNLHALLSLAECGV